MRTKRCKIQPILCKNEALTKVNARGFYARMMSTFCQAHVGAQVVMFSNLFECVEPKFAKFGQDLDTV